MTRTKNTFLALMAVLLSPMVANAGMIEVNSGVFWDRAGGVGTGRAQGILANSAFSISSVGIFGDLVERSFEVVIYASTNGSDVVSELASAGATVGGIGNDWNDIDINFSFDAGSYYIINWRPSTNDSGWATTLDYYNDSGLPTTVGPLTLVDGLEGFNAQNAFNFLHPNLRYNMVSVAEPGVLALVGIGLLGLGAMRRRKKI